jgi:hypothetical protein
MRTLSSRLVRDARRSQHTDDFDVDSSWSQSRVTCEISRMTDGENLDKRVNKFTALADVEGEEGNHALARCWRFSNCGQPTRPCTQSNG